MKKREKPYILAPAGDRDSFLAAIAAGADAVYCGLKIFSARMEADNFGTEELAGMVTLARSRGVEVYVAFNSMIKPGELEKTARLIKKLAVYVNPHALIIQDPAVVPLARKAGFKGELHLSTLSNPSFGRGLEQAHKMGFHRAVLSRELNVDEIKSVAALAPEGLDLEVFIHGALCYAVSGRCYWSSWFGGRSGLRGRCVQPCRRMYSQKGEKSRFFSCLDLSVDVLAKVLKEIPKVTTWKIEGRKKSPHYVFYTVRAYQMLRDEGRDPQKRKTALAFLEYALGRPFTHYNFLSQRKINPINRGTETGSGLFAGRISKGPSPYFITREPLFQGDLLRLGYEDDKGHAIQRVNRSVPKKGKFVLKKNRNLAKGAPVFIVDRREPEVKALIKELALELEAIEPVKVRPVQTDVHPSPGPSGKRNRGRAGRTLPLDMRLSRKPGRGRMDSARALWLTPEGGPKLPNRQIQDTWWWLPPVIWPEEEEKWERAVQAVLSKGGRRFVLNMIWQRPFFPKTKGLELWAGPFCNLANGEAINSLKAQGFSGAMVSPELGENEFLALPGMCELPLGIVVKGNWPLCISRTLSPDIRLNSLFSSPMGEKSWVSKRDDNFWVFPEWELDLTSKRKELQNAGFQVFVSMEEPIPKGVVMKKRPGLWNWKMSVL
ncbi:peptidase U32 family protein [Desulfospira joergensenii]|uniref:peptidase U32 family protein n=1 Tax=Desulfospira joergensenii TaxID=53329 RepID=UPI0003B43B52|nr:peptidase U32 family protein [Desulfospira joergensenii]